MDRLANSLDMETGGKPKSIKLNPQDSNARV